MKSWHLIIRHCITKKTGKKVTLLKAICKNILTSNFTFTPKDMKTHVFIPFRIDQEYHALYVRCRYSPKTVEDMLLAERLAREAIRKYFSPSRQEDADWRSFLSIQNLITLSIDYEQEYAGCTHRHDAEQHHMISSNYASPGFDKRRVLPGQWQAVLSLHAVYVPVDYELVIEAGDDVGY